MAKEVQTHNSHTQEQQVQQQKPVLTVKTALMVGIPLFIVQVVVVYFLVAKFFGADVQPPNSQQRTVEQQHTGGETGKIFVVKDMIVNPAGTNGSRYLLVTVGLEASSSKVYDELQQKEVQVCDVLNALFASKTLWELIDVTKRETLRKEVAKRTSALLTNGTVTNVYFSKYIIQ
ncbi:MAG: flagellar basal body-associated FliL family protein [Bacteroidetes bacterium]|nr:flagellar basal body-associated FliL family protein [Bacteroidota bacterium]